MPEASQAIPQPLAQPKPSRWARWNARVKWACRSAAVAIVALLGVGWNRFWEVGFPLPFSPRNASVLIDDDDLVVFWGYEVLTGSWSTPDDPDDFEEDWIVWDFAFVSEGEGYLSVSLWPALALLTLTSPWWFPWRHYIPAHCCRACGYDLRGNPAATVCAECGVNIVRDGDEA